MSTRGDHLSFLVVGEAGQENLSKGSEGASKTTHVATLLPFTEKGASLCLFSRVLACLMDTFGSMHSFLVTNLNKRPEPKQWLVAHRGASPGRSSECELQLGPGGGTPRKLEEGRQTLAVGLSPRCTAEAPGELLVPGDARALAKMG